MRIRYLRIVRQAHRLLRKPSLKKRPWLQALTRNFLDRELWHPCRDTVAGGLSIGLFLSQLPIPFQMVVAAVAAIRAKVNVPFALAACWVTNPLTIFPITIWHVRLGEFFRDSLGIPMHPFLDKHITLPVFQTEVNLASYVLGFILSGVLLSLLAYPIVYLFSALLPKLLPKIGYRRARAKVMARRKASQKTP